MLTYVAFEYLIFVLAKRASEHVLLHSAQHIAITDAAQQQIDGVKVNRFKWNRRICRFWQYISPPWEAGRGCAIPDIKRQRDILDQALTAGRRQASAECDLIARAMLDAVDTNLTAIRLHRKICAGKLDERRVIHSSFYQAFGKFGANTRRGRIFVDAMLGDAKAVFGDGFVERGDHVIAGLNALGEAQRWNHIAPTLQLLHRFRHDLQRTDPGRIIRRAQIGVAGRVQRALTQLARVRAVLAFHL